MEATAAPAVETARQEVQNIEIEDVIEDDIIKPIHRQYSEVHNIFLKSFRCWMLVTEDVVDDVSDLTTWFRKEQVTKLLVQH